MQNLQPNTTLQAGLERKIGNVILKTLTGKK